MFELRREVRVGCFVLIPLTAACAIDDDGRSRTRGEVTTAAQVVDASVAADGGVAPGGDFPCDVKPILAERCTVCHGDPPLAAPFPLDTPARFQGESYSDPEQTMVEVVKARINAENEGDLMPPPALGTLSEEELAALNRWLAGGAKPGAGACPGPDADAGVDVPSTDEADGGAD